ncbi:TetR/AcrR family transcriptional regulator [Micromonospora sp. LOL_021]|uniref:TetR/AcrR family transcriptional regulator n=1 Tax=Micromonospora sp. LOL_021 TaxID=3345417 RepID=UPI003A8BF515
MASSVAMGGRELNRSTIVAAGRRLAQSEGVGAVSMRRVAAELGCSAMALYRHVSDKRELLILVLDDVASGLPLPVVDGPSGRRLFTLFDSLHGYLGGFPWVVDVLREGELFAPQALRFTEAVLEALAAAGVHGSDALGVYAALWQYTLGHLASAHPPKDPTTRARRDELARRAPLDELPRMRSIMPLLVEFDAEAVYAAGLTALIRGALPADHPNG